MLIWAHRGDSHACPENTLAAFAAAIAAGADGVEFDVQLSRDGVPVVIHDETLERTTGARGPVRARTAAQLQALSAGLARPGWESVGIPLLADVLALLAPSTLLVNVELKNSVVEYPGLEEVVVEAVATAGLPGERVVLSSFSPTSTARLARLTDLEVALVYSRPWPAPVRLACELGAQAIHPSRLMVGPGLVPLAHRRGLRVRAWNVNGAAQVRRMRVRGVDGVFTDDPVAARRLLTAAAVPRAQDG